ARPRRRLKAAPKGLRGFPQPWRANAARVPPPSRRPTAVLLRTPPLLAQRFGRPTFSRRLGGGTPGTLQPLAR
ncbi:MAG TPA: hypothetical protein VFU69_02875, partial [Ktedonobacterales bacterium]|nr:hypothetical protein [Ktedonobacterales bacterium]